MRKHGLSDSLAAKRERKQSSELLPFKIEDRLDVEPVSARSVARQTRHVGIGSNSKVPPSRIGKLAISGYYDPVFRIQLATLSAREQVSQQALLGEALNLLFESRTKNSWSKSIAGNFDRDTVDMFNARAIKNNVTREELLAEAVDLLFAKYGDGQQRG